MRVLLIGGTGFIGPCIVRELVGRGHEVAVFHRGRSEPDLPGEVRHIHCPEGFMGNRSVLDQYRGELSAFQPDVVCDMILVTEADARAVVDTFRGQTQRVVALSSQDVYRAYGVLNGSEPGPPVPVPMDEEAPLRQRLYPYRTDPPRPAEDPGRWLDDYDKILVERALLAHEDLPATILRLPMVYGPGDRQRRLWEPLRRMVDDRPAILLEEGLAGWCWTRGYVEDMAHAAVLALENPRGAGRIYNVGEPGALTQREWTAAIGRAAGWSGRILALPAEQLPESLRTSMNTRQNLVVDTTRIRQELGYQETVPPAEALARTVAWERDTLSEARRDSPDYAAEDSVLERLASAGGPG